MRPANRAGVPHILLQDMLQVRRVHMRLEDDGVDRRVADVLNRVRPRLVMHHVAVRDIDFHGVIANVDACLSATDEIHGLVGVGMLRVFL